MTDSERTFLDVAIMEVLPQLQAVNKNILEEHLQSIGVETYDDLRFFTIICGSLTYPIAANALCFTPKFNQTDEIPLEDRAAMQDTYGCIKWNVKFLPLEETQESQQQKMEKLKVMFQHSDANPEEVKCLMKSTFYTQRQHVNQGKSIKCLREEWPFWFDELGMSVHFMELTGIDLKETFTRNLDLKGKRLLDYLTTVCVNKSKKFLQNYARLQRMRGLQSGCSDDVIEMTLLLLSYFDEKESMFFHVEDTCLAEEVQLEQVPLTPVVIVCGQSCYSSTRYMLSLDRNLINTNISSFISALCLMFGSYYCFNIHYPSELASTLEFLQR
ncbi:uncharacterized protein LOC122334911 [Puntigrus tetrazona]|uniref:uncharacterized protein LOC122334911 n=1 Tax=Puntigrus tetrazona TaxID=1606681 RepID=UPI001C8A6D2A|nr:uncharacterized protein LOC122334911 [Puntigrus tetrazona]